MRSFVLVLGLLCLFLDQAPARAQSDEKPIQLALFNPVQVVSEADAIRGVRLSLLFGKNTNVSGLDVGVVPYTTGDFVGAQWAVVGLTDGDVTGYQQSFVNVVRGELLGAQVGIVSIAESGEGLQWSGVNHSRNFRGLQVAVVNYAQRLNGVQIGLINIIGEGGFLPVFPIVNWSFPDG